MEAWMALLSIIAIVAIVLITSGLVAFFVHMIIGTMDTDKNAKPKSAEKELLDYNQFKQLEDSKKAEVEQAENKETKVEETKETESVETEQTKTEQEETEDVEVEETETAEVEETETEEDSNEEVEDFDDLDALLTEISSEVVEEQKEKIQEEPAAEMSDELKAYNIDEYTKSFDEESEEDEAEEEQEEVEESDETETDERVAKVLVDAVENKTEELVDANQEIENLKAQLASLNKQLEEARANKGESRIEVVTIDMTEEECLERLETLENRLKDVKKDYKINYKEYKPLKKVMHDLEKYQNKLRRKETIVAKKKVALYGVNNYVDIDKEKAEKLANEIELLEGLRLSVNHCEEVINANKDRYPILEHTNQILEDQIANIEADMEATRLTLQKIREKNGEGDDNQGNGENGNFGDAE